MQINSGYETQNIWDLNYISSNSSSGKSTFSGASESKSDTAEISSEARELFSKMIHKYDRPESSEGANRSESEATMNSGGNEEAAPAADAQQTQGTGGGSGGSDSSDSVQKIKQQIQALKSQLMSMTSGMEKGGNNANMAEVNAISAQIAALEAELTAMEAVG